MLNLRRCGVGVLAWALVPLALITLSGCRPRQRELAPVTGKVLYQGKPLKFGTVMIEHDHGQPATAAIQPDGTFVIETRGEGQGAAVGKRRVRVACYEAQDPDRQPSDNLGESLIPRKYTSFETSGLVIDVRPGRNEPLAIELTDD